MAKSRLKIRSTPPPPRPDRKKISEQAVAASMDAMVKLGDELLDGDIDVGEFEAEFKAELKAAYITQYLFGIGGLANMTADDWAQVAKDLEKQYKFIDDYVDELSDAVEQDQEALVAALADGGADGMGDLLPSALAALLWRISLYADSAGSVYEGAATGYAEKTGATQELWNLDDGVVDHCDKCPEFADMGLQPLGTFPDPGDGNTPCGNNCHCWKTFYDADGEEI